MTVRLAAAVAAFALVAAAPPRDKIINDIFDQAPKGAALDAAIAKAAAAPLGSADNPVRVTMPQGEQDYLVRLRCSDGTAPEFGRSGSTGFGPYKMILDLFEVHCATGQPSAARIYMDMYHAYNEPAAVPGFAILPPGGRP